MDVWFGEFSVNADTRQLLRGQLEVHLSPKAFDLLRLLLNARPRALSKTELAEQLWPATFVSDASLSVLVAEIRAALGDDAHDSRFVRTVHRYGYAFCGETTAPGPRASAAPRELACWLVTGEARTAITRDASVIGRDPEAEVWIDLPGVSRRHARIDIEAGAATVADLGSKNGTFVRGERVTVPTPLHDGDEIRVGPVAFTFRSSSAMAATETATSAHPSRTARPEL